MCTFNPVNCSLTLFLREIKDVLPKLVCENDLLRQLKLWGHMMSGFKNELTCQHPVRNNLLRCDDQPVKWRCIWNQQQQLYMSYVIDVTFYTEEEQTALKTFLSGKEVFTLLIGCSSLIWCCLLLLLFQISCCFPNCFKEDFSDFSVEQPAWCVSLLWDVNDWFSDFKFWACVKSSADESPELLWRWHSWCLQHRSQEHNNEWILIFILKWPKSR